MAAEITAIEIAKRLGIEAKTFGAWLRREASAGHPSLAAHQHGSPWTFAPGEARALEADYVGRGQGAAATRNELQRPLAPADRRAPVLTALTSIPGAAKDGHTIEVDWLGETVRTLADLLRPGLRAVTIGINPAPVSVHAGHYYQGRAGQTFYRRLHSIGLLPPGAGFEDDRLFAAGVGFTDVVKRPTRCATEISKHELAYGRSALEERLRKVGAPLVIFVFKKAAVTMLGTFEGHGLLAPTKRLNESPVFVMPGPYEHADRAEYALERLQQYLIAG
jgi:TDG/mug DNA glycosylase family protein